MEYTFECILHPYKHFDVMFKSYLQLHVGCNYTYAINEKINCSNHLKL
jgi:hypothetical protein